MPSDRRQYHQNAKSEFRKFRGVIAVGVLFGLTGIITEARGQQPELSASAANSAALSEMAHEAMGEMEIRLLPVENDLPLLREQSDPILRARMRIREARRELAIRQALDAAARTPRSTKPQDPSTVVGDWRFSIGNNGNWSPYPDRELDARNLSFPMRKDSRADKRTDQQRALDQLRRQNR